MTSFDFSKVTKSKNTQTDPDWSNPVMFFYKLSHPTIRDLYPVQRDIIQEWYNGFRIGHNDKMISLNTGGGKTLIGLMIAESIRREKNGKVLYVCPNNFLGKQTLDEIEKCGIKSSSYLNMGTGKPVWEDKDSFLDNSAICVTNYDSVFNSKSIFREFEIGGIIFDDAHLSLDLLDKQYSLRVEEVDLIHEVLDIFKTSPTIKEKIISIKEGDPLAVVMIPQLEWHQHAAAVKEILLKRKDVVDSLSWLNLKEVIDKTFCFVSSTKIEISLLYPNTRNHYLFNGDVQRVFLSATLPNLDDITRVFGLTPTRIETTNPDYRPQRLIIFSNKTNIENHDELIRDNLTKISDKCLIIAPSKEQTNKFASVGAVVASNSADVIRVVDKFKKDSKGIIALANRYDGIDLPGDACHCLILEGVPYTGTLKTRFFSEYFHNHHNSFLRSVVASKLVQAFGRTVRGNDDYSIIILLGDKLNSWVMNRDNRKFFKKDLSEDVEIGIDVSGSVGSIDSLLSLSQEILNQTAGWKDFFNDRKSNVITPAVITRDEENASVAFSQKERKINDLFLVGKYKECLELILENQKEILEYSKPILGLYLGMASVCCLETNDHRLELLSARAYGINPIFGMPVALAGVTRSLQSQRVIDNDASLPGFDWTQKDKKFDENMRMLGEALGFSSSRPEINGDGTLDVCWVDEEKKVVIGFENKVGKVNKVLSKQEIDQCSGHVNWLKFNFPDHEQFIYAVGEIEGYNELASPDELMYTGVADVASVCEKLLKLYGKKIYPDQIDPAIDEFNLRIDKMFERKMVIDLPKVKNC